MLQLQLFDFVILFFKGGCPKQLEDLEHVLGLFLVLPNKILDGLRFGKLHRHVSWRRLGLRDRGMRLVHSNSLDWRKFQVEDSWLWLIFLGLGLVTVLDC